MSDPSASYALPLACPYQRPLPFTEPKVRRVGVRSIAHGPFRPAGVLRTQVCQREGGEVEVHGARDLQVAYALGQQRLDLCLAIRGLHVEQRLEPAGIADDAAVDRADRAHAEDVAAAEDWHPGELGRHDPARDRLRRVVRLLPPNLLNVRLRCHHRGKRQVVPSQPPRGQPAHVVRRDPARRRGAGQEHPGRTHGDADDLPDGDTHVMSS